MADFGVNLSGLASTMETLDDLNRSWGEMMGHVVVADAEHAVYVEYGTSSMPANGAMRDAVKSVEGDIDKLAGKAESADQLSRMIAEQIAERWRADVWVDTGELRDSIHVEETK